MSGQEFSRGIEKIIALAALDAEFSKKLLTDREAAIDSCDIKLTETEHAILLSIPNPQLDRAVSSVRVPDLARRKFLVGSVRTAINIIVVVGMVGVIASISTGVRPGPGAAQEASAIANLHTIHWAQDDYRMKHGCFAGTLEQLIDAELISNKFSSGIHHGYTYKLSDVTEETFELRAIPEKEGQRFFFIDQKGNIHHSHGPQVGPQSKRLGQ